MDTKKKFEQLFNLGGTSAYDMLKDGNIYVENMRSMMNVSTTVAKAKCEQAVESGLFIQMIGLLCPNDDRMMASFGSRLSIPATIKCNICENDEADKFEFDTEYIRQIIYYKIIE